MANDTQTILQKILIKLEAKSDTTEVTKVVQTLNHTLESLTGKKKDVNIPVEFHLQESKKGGLKAEVKQLTQVAESELRQLSEITKKVAELEAKRAKFSETVVSDRQKSINNAGYYQTLSPKRQQKTLDYQSFLTEASQTKAQLQTTIKQVSDLDELNKLTTRKDWLQQAIARNLQKAHKNKNEDDAEQYSKTIDKLKRLKLLQKGLDADIFSVNNSPIRQLAKQIEVSANEEARNVAAFKTTVSSAVQKGQKRYVSVLADLQKVKLTQDIQDLAKLKEIDKQAKSIAVQASKLNQETLSPAQKDTLKKELGRVTRIPERVASRVGWLNSQQKGKNRQENLETKEAEKARAITFAGRRNQEKLLQKRADEERQRLIKLDKLRDDAIRFKGLNDLKEVERVQNEIAALHQQQEAYQRRKDYQADKAGKNRQENLETKEAEKARAITFAGRRNQEKLLQKRADEERQRLIKLDKLRDDAIRFKGLNDLKEVERVQNEIAALHQQQEAYQRRKDYQADKAGKNRQENLETKEAEKARAITFAGRRNQEKLLQKRADEERQRFIKLDKLRDDAIRFKGLNDLKEVERVQNEIAALHQQQEAYQRRKDYQADKAGKNRQENLETKEAEKARAITFAGRRNQEKLLQKRADEERQRLIKLDKLRDDAIRFKGLNDLKEVERVQNEIAALHQQQEAYQRRKDYQADKAGKNRQENLETKEAEKARAITFAGRRNQEKLLQKRADEERQRLIKLDKLRDDAIRFKGLNDLKEVERVQNEIAALHQQQEAYQRRKDYQADKAGKNRQENLETKEAEKARAITFAGRRNQEKLLQKRADEERQRLIKLDKLRDDAIRFKGLNDLKEVERVQNEIAALHQQQEAYQRRKDYQADKAGKNRQENLETKEAEKARAITFAGRRNQEKLLQKRADEERQRLIKLDKLRDDAIRFKGLNDLKEVERVQNEIAALHQQQEAYQRRKDYQADKAGKNRQENLETKEAEKARAITFAGRRNQEKLLQKRADEERQRLIKLDKLRDDAIRFKGLNDLKEVERVQNEIAALHQQQEAYQRRKDYQADKAAKQLQDQYELEQRRKVLDPHQYDHIQGEQLAKSGRSYNSMDRASEVPLVRSYHKEELLEAKTRHNIARENGDTLGMEREAKNIEHHAKQFERATQAAKEYHGVVGKISHAFDTLTRYGAVGAIVYNIANAFKAVVASVIELEDEMKNIQAITSSSDTQMAVIGQSIKDTATTTAFSIKEISEAVKTVAQAGVEMKDIPKTVQAIADVATATGSQLQTAADIITTVKEVWDNVDVSTIGDRVAQAANISKLAVEDLKTILSLNASAAKSANVSLEQSLSLDALLRNSGVKGSTIATGSTQLYRELFSPDKKFADFLAKQYGKIGENTTSEEASKRFSDYRNSDNPLVEAISELKRIGVGDHESIAALERSMDSRALNVFKPLLNSKESLQGLEAQMRAGATASEGAATASHTVKKAFENLGDQVEVLADAMGTPFLEVIREVLEAGKEGAKGATEFVENGNLLSEQSLRREKRHRSKAHDAFTRGETLKGVSESWEAIKEEVLWITDPSRHVKKAGESISDVSLKSLLAQQASKQRELEKGLEQYKAFSDSPDSLKTSFEDKKSAFNNFDSSLLDVFGKSSTGPNQKEEIIGLLAELSKKSETQRKPDIDLIKKKLGSTKDINVEEVSRIANEAEGIKESLAAMTKAYKSTFVALVETEHAVGLNPAQTTLLNQLKEIKANPEADSAIFGNKPLSIQKSIQLHDQINNVMAPGVLEAKKTYEDWIAKSLAAQASAAIRTPEKSIGEAELVSVKMNLDEKLKAGTVEEAKKIQDSILKVIQSSSELDAAQKKTLSDLVIETAQGAIGAIAKTLADSTANITERLKTALEEANKIPEADLNQSEISAKKAAQKTYEERQQYGKATGVYGNIINSAAEATGDDPLEIAAFLAPESGGDPLAVSPAGAQGLMQLIPSTRAEVNKKYGDKYGFGNSTFGPHDNVFAGAAYKKELKNKSNVHSLADQAAAYNMGPGAYDEWVNKHGKDLLWLKNNYIETYNHIGKVQKAYDAEVAKSNKALEPSQDGKGEIKKHVARNLAILQGANATFDAKYLKPFAEANSQVVEESQLKVQELQRKIDAANAKKDSVAASGLDAEKSKETLNTLNMALDWVENKQKPDQSKSAAQQEKAKTLAITKIKGDIEEEKTRAAKSKETYEVNLKPKTFNFDDEKYVATQDRARDAQNKVSELSTQGVAKNKDEIVKQLREHESSSIAGVQMQLDKLDKNKLDIFGADGVKSVEEGGTNAFGNARKKLQDQIKDIQDKTKREVDKVLETTVLKEAQSTVKAIEKELDANTLKLDEAQALGNTEVVSALLASQKELDEKLQAATLKRIEADKNSTAEEIDTAKSDYANKQKKRELEAAAIKISTRDAEFHKKTDDPIEEFAQKGRQEALGHSQYLPDQQAQNVRDIEAWQDKLSKAQADLSSAQPNTEVFKKYEDEVNAATQALAKLKTEAQDLAPTLESEFSQISTDNIVSEINNLNGSLKNLDKNITQRVVQFADQMSTDVADSAITAAKGLLGFNTATKEATDALTNLAQQKGDAALVKTNRVQLAQEINSVRLNETDPARQEMLIASAEEAQKQAEDLAQFQVNEAQKAADKVEFDQSLAGKMQKGAGDLVSGVASDVIKSEVLGMFTDVLGESRENPMFVEVTNLPEFGIGAVPKGGLDSKPLGFFGTLGKKVSGLFSDSTEGIAPQSEMSYPEASGMTTIVNAPAIDGVSAITPLSYTGGYGATPELTPIGNSGSQAQGADQIPTAVETGAASGVETGFTNIFDDAKGLFSDFTSNMTGSWTTFIGSLSATLGVLGSSKKKKSGFEIAQMVIGGIGAVAGAVGSIGGALGSLGAFSNAGSMTGQGLGQLGGNQGAGFDSALGLNSMNFESQSLSNFNMPSSMLQVSTGGAITNSQVQKYSTGGYTSDNAVNHYATGGVVNSEVGHYATGGVVNSEVGHYATGGGYYNQASDFQNHTNQTQNNTYSRSSKTSTSKGTVIYDPQTGTTDTYPDYTQHGYITGPGSEKSDSIPARLSNGEYVLNARTTKAIGKETLDAWNFANKFPIKRATGGMADPMNYAASQVSPATPAPPAPAPASEQAIRIVMVDDQRKVGDYMSSAEGEKTLVDFVRRNSLSIKQILR